MKKDSLRSFRRGGLRALTFCAITTAGIWSGGLLANNGLTMTSYGAASAGMGGATLAVGNSVMDLEANVANLARLKQGIFEAGAGIMFPMLNYQDSYVSPNDSSRNYVNNVNSEKSVFPLPYIGYVAPINDHSGWGIAFYAQGGMGADFKHIVRNTPGNATMNTLVTGMTNGGVTEVPMMGDAHLMQESTHSQFALMKLTPGYAYRMGKLSVGLGLDLNIATLEWSWTFQDPMGMSTFPGAGYKYEGERAYSFGGKVGLTYDIDDSWAIAYSYISADPLRFNGKMSANEYNQGYKYDVFRAKVLTKLTFAEQQFAGIAYKKNGLTIGLDIGYINWGSYLKTMSFTLNMPWVPNPMLQAFGVMDPTTNLTFHTNFHDQQIYAVGVEYRPEKLAYRIGYNYSPKAMRGDGVNPMFPAISDKHAMIGLGYRMDKTDIDFAIEYAFPSTVHTSMMSDWTVMHAFGGFGQANFENPYFNSQITMRQIIPHIGIKSYF